MNPASHPHPLVRPAYLALLAALAAAFAFAVAAAPASAAPGDFIEPNSSPEDAAADRPTDVVSADLDGDLDIDAAITDRNGDAVKIMKNDGTGNLTLSQSVSVGDFPQGIVTAKLDAGGSIDLAVTNDTDNTVQVLLNNGSGTFTALTAVDVPDLNEPIDAGELVGTGAANDGITDIVVSQSFDTVRVLRNDGNGLLSLAASFATVGSPNITDLIAPPLAGDFDDDIALTKGGAEDRVITYTNDGDNTFTLDENIATGLEASSIVAAPISSFDEGTSGSTFAARDLAVANGSNGGGVPGNNSVTILLNDGSGGLTQPATSPEPVSGGVGGELVVGDFDGSSSTDDLAVAGGAAGVSILLNPGTGNFTEPPSSPYDGTDFVTYLGLATADVDGDGDDDVYSANDDAGTNDVSVLLDNEDGDGDGVADIDDACPTQPAATANGCPPAPPSGGGGGGTTPPGSGGDGKINDFDTTAKKTQQQQGTIKVKVSAGAQEAVTVRGTGKIKVKNGKKGSKSYKLKSVTKTVEAGERVILRFKLTKKKLQKKVKKALKRYKKANGKRKQQLTVKAQIKVVATAADGDRLVEKRVIRLR